MNQNKLEEIIFYQKRTLEFLKRELERAIEADKAVEELDDNIGFDAQQETGEVKEGEPNI